MIKKIKISRADEINLANTKIDKSALEDDFFDYSKSIVKKPWGYEYLIYSNEISAVWVLYIKKGCQTSMHCHQTKKTSLIVLSGEVMFSTINEKIRRKPGDGLCIDKSVFHSTKSLSKEGSFIMEIETPINKRDLVRLKDRYGRVGKGYETAENFSFNVQNYNYISFIDPKVYYNTKKKFGRCSISLLKFKDDKEFRENFLSENIDAVSILKGKIFDGERNMPLKVGDTLDLKKFKFHEDMHIENEVELIVIKRIDNIIKISDYVVSLLEKEGIKDIFVVPGSTNVHLLDSLGKNISIRHISTQTEQAASIAAESYAKFTGELGVSIISSGAAGANAVIGVADAWVDSTPLIIISGQCQSDQTTDGKLRQLGVQELDITNIVKSIAKYAVKITNPYEIGYHLEKGIYMAKHGRPGPVWIDIPIDVQGMNIDEEELLKFSPSELEEPIAPALLKEKVFKALGLLKKSKRPVILAGNGIRIAKAEENFIKLIELLSIPILASKRGADIIPDSHPLFFGRPGAYGQRSANLIIQNADLLISIGSRLSIPQIGRNYRAFARQAKKIIVDIDKYELQKKTLKADILIDFSARDFILEMLKQIKNYDNPDITGWLDKCIGLKSKFSSSLNELEIKNDSVNAYLFMDVLSDELKEGDVMTSDGGSLIIYLMQQFKFKKNQRLISATGLDNPSFALPASIGASLAAGKSIICICEDTGFQKHVQELETIFNYNLNIKIFVLNNKGNLYIRKIQGQYFGSRYVASQKPDEIHLPDIAKIGDAYGILSFRIKSNRELRGIIKKVLRADRSAICEVNIDKDQQIIPRIVFTVKPDGKWIAKPLEDMYPFLDRNKFKENMIIDIFDED